MADRLEGLVSSIHDHLAATEELPLEEEANRLLGEAQAVAADAEAADLDAATTKERVEEILALLEEVDGTGHDEADEHVAAARRAAQRALDQ
jgi:outer membrane murein-binding lipoprotein Lpp